MAAPNYTRVMREVRKVLRENSISAPPIQPREIAESYGIDVKEVEFDDSARDVAGFFDFEENVIYVNGREPFNRKTFTIAHELGHYFLHRELFEKDPNRYTVLMRRPMKAANDPLEKEANAFAANFLVPRKFLEHYAPLASVDELAKVFIVSRDVIRARLQYEGLSEPVEG